MTDDYQYRFGGIGRLFGTNALDVLQRAHVCVIGVGGVGSWAVEALARSGIGELTAIDWDDICVTNVNRQLHAVDGEIGRAKVEALADRVKAINAGCRFHECREFFSEASAERILETPYDYVLDAIDSAKPKCLLIAMCRRRRIPVIPVGGAGGRVDPPAVQVTDLARFLNKMGACIEGIETSTLTIDGVQELHGVDYEVMPDRIEAGTYLIAGAVTRGNISVEGVQPAQLEALTDTLDQAGVLLDIGENKIQVASNGSIRPVNVATLPYPGFPTDLQAPLTVLLTQADGTSQIIENVYKDRFMHVPELNRLGANIRQNDNHATLSGPSNLSGADVMASDLRAGASLILAGLAAKDRTVIHRVYHIDRGYERIEEKLAGLGASIWRDDKGEEPPPETKATRIPVHQV